MENTQSQNANVLIVDDEPLLCDIFGEWLEMEGWPVLTAGDGAAALRVLSTNHVSVMVTDVCMPVMDGIALAKALNASGGGYVPKIIFISGFSDIEARDAYDLGVEVLLHKPIDRKDFVSAIRRCLQSHEKTWSESAAEMGLPLSMSLPPVPKAIEQGLIRFGRGGFCLRARLPFGDGIVRFELSFESEPYKFAGLGAIRWNDPSDNQVGIEIRNLDPDCLERAVKLIGLHGGPSYIPRTCGHRGSAAGR
jgi:CheY-like chemotaxis protein